jgi:DNA-binding NarL/FixJ family response regulator/signal transduction histidine kinase
MSLMQSRATRRVGTGVRRAARLPPALRRLQPLAVGRRTQASLIAIAVVILAWAVVAADVPAIRFVSVAPRAQASIEAASALLRLFGALVLFLLPAGRAEQRLRWVAAGLVVLALGGLAFGTIPAELGVLWRPNTSIYLWLAIRLIASILFVVAFVPARSIAFTRRTMIVTLAILAAISGLILVTQSALPDMVSVPNVARTAAYQQIDVEHLTAWQWVTEITAIALALAATLGAVRRVAGGVVWSWLLLAMVLHAGSQLHGALFPSPYGPLFSSADLLRDAFALTVAVGGTLALRRIAEERATLLSVEREYSRGLAELNELKANFVAMVAHELGSPIGAIRAIAGLMEAGELSPGQAREAIETEADALSTLVADVRLGSAVEQRDFVVQPRPVALSVLLGDAAAFARILPGDHSVTRTLRRDAVVLADPERVRQVLRNLLTNAAKFSPAGMPIELSADVHEGRATIEIADRGFGIPPEEMEMIFGKFSRGHDARMQGLPGFGLGLYLSRRLIQAHGSDLKAEPRTGGGTSFRFDLTVAPVDSVAVREPEIPVRVLLVDDHASFRQSLARILDRDPGVRSVQQAGVVATARPLLREVDVALIDLQLPDGRGADVIAELHRSCPAAGIIALTGTNDSQELAAAVDAGAIGLLHKSASIDEIITAVRRAAAREPLLSHREVAEMVRLAREQREQVQSAEAALRHLTPREREVLKAVAAGLSDKEIGRTLGISAATARTHVVNILGKLGVNSRLQAVVLATKHGVIDLG